MSSSSSSSSSADRITPHTPTATMEDFEDARAASYHSESSHSYVPSAQRAASADAFDTAQSSSGSFATRSRPILSSTQTAETAPSHTIPQSHCENQQGGDPDELVSAPPASVLSAPLADVAQTPSPTQPTRRGLLQRARTTSHTHAASETSPRHDRRNPFSIMSAFRRVKGKASGAPARAGTPQPAERPNKPSEHDYDLAAHAHPLAATPPPGEQRFHPQHVTSTSLPGEHRAREGTERGHDDQTLTPHADAMRPIWQTSMSQTGERSVHRLAGRSISPSQSTHGVSPGGIDGNTSKPLHATSVARSNLPADSSSYVVPNSHTVDKARRESSRHRLRPRIASDPAMFTKLQNSPLAVDHGRSRQAGATRGRLPSATRADPSPETGVSQSPAQAHVTRSLLDIGARFGRAQHDPSGAAPHQVHMPLPTMDPEPMWVSGRVTPPHPLPLLGRDQTTELRLVPDAGAASGSASTAPLGGSRSSTPVRDGSNLSFSLDALADGDYSRPHSREDLTLSALEALAEELTPNAPISDSSNSAHLHAQLRRTPDEGSNPESTAMGDTSLLGTEDPVLRSPQSMPAQNSNSILTTTTTTTTTTTVIQQPKTTTLSPPQVQQASTSTKVSSGSGDPVESIVTALVDCTAARDPRGTETAVSLLRAMAANSRGACITIGNRGGVDALVGVLRRFLVEDVAVIGQALIACGHLAVDIADNKERFIAEDALRLFGDCIDRYLRLSPYVARFGCTAIRSLMVNAPKDALPAALAADTPAVIVRVLNAALSARDKSLAKDAMDCLVSVISGTDTPQSLPLFKSQRELETNERKEITMTKIRVRSTGGIDALVDCLTEFRADVDALAVCLGCVRTVIHANASNTLHFGESRNATGIHTLLSLFVRRNPIQPTDREDGMGIVRTANVDGSLADGRLQRTFNLSATAFKDSQQGIADPTLRQDERLGSAHQATRPNVGVRRSRSELRGPSLNRSTSASTGTSEQVPARRASSWLGRASQSSLRSRFERSNSNASEASKPGLFGGSTAHGLFDVPASIVSANTSAQSMERCVPLGCDDIYGKESLGNSSCATGIDLDMGLTTETRVEPPEGLSDEILACIADVLQCLALLRVNRQTILQNQGVHVLVCLISRLKHSSRSVPSALLALWRCTARSDDAAAQACICRAAPVIVDVMQRHAHRRAIQRLGLALLVALTELNDGNRHAACSAGAVSAVFFALTEHGRSEDVVARSCRFFLLLSPLNILAAGIDLERLIRVVTLRRLRHSSSSLVQQASRDLLEALEIIPGDISAIVDASGLNMASADMMVGGLNAQNLNNIMTGPTKNGPPPLLSPRALSMGSPARSQRRRTSDSGAAEIDLNHPTKLGMRRARGLGARQRRLSGFMPSRRQGIPLFGHKADQDPQHAQAPVGNPSSLFGLRASSRDSVGSSNSSRSSRLSSRKSSRKHALTAYATATQYIAMRPLRLTLKEARDQEVSLLSGISAEIDAGVLNDGAELVEPGTRPEPPPRPRSTPRPSSAPGLTHEAARDIAARSPRYFAGVDDTAGVSTSVGTPSGRLSPSPIDNAVAPGRLSAADASQALLHREPLGPSPRQYVEPHHEYDADAARALVQNSPTRPSLREMHVGSNSPDSGKRASSPNVMAGEQAQQLTRPGPQPMQLSNVLLPGVAGAEEGAAMQHLLYAPPVGASMSNAGASRRPDSRRPWQDLSSVTPGRRGESGSLLTPPTRSATSSPLPQRPSSTGMSAAPVTYQDLDE